MKIKVIYVISLFAIAIQCFFPLISEAQSQLQTETENFEKAQVLDVTNQNTKIIAGTDTTSLDQTLKAEVIDGVDKGRVVTFDNDYIQLKTGDIFYIRHTVDKLASFDVWSVGDPYRLNILAVLAVVFLISVFIFGGIQGIRGLASLCGSFILIFYLLIPGILAGLSPILISIGVSSVIILVGSYITHGFNKTTTAAILGMIVTVLITGLAAYYFIHAAHLSGFTSEENVYLNFDSRGQINMLGLLFGGIMIGLLGVLYDIAIGQAVAVEELFIAGKELKRIEVYKKAIRIGREHIGALVNTLAIAYVGVSLPLLLVIQHSTTGVLYILNNETFSTEIIRILIGGIGLVLGVPITTLIASYMLSKSKEKNGTDERPFSSHKH